MEDNVPTSAGLSSFNLLDEQKFFAGLGLKKGMTLLDLGCGLGNYTVAASSFIGDQGRIVAMDPWHEGIETLAVRLQVSRLGNIHPLIGDAAQGLPIKNRSVDCCLMATVAHILLRENVLDAVLGELQDIIRRTGILAFVEFHKVEGPPGPPRDWRISPSALEDIVISRGYNHVQHLDVGPYNYMSLFQLQCMDT